jgi:hypothetical protein
MLNKHSHSYTHMNIQGYISDIIKKGSIPTGIDTIDQTFLKWILEGYTSAYRIHSKHEEQNGPIAYKNVHRRIKKLFNSKLIEEVIIHGGFKHGAINYKLTTRGLVYYFAELEGLKFFELDAPNIRSISLTHSQDILFSTFLYPYFEKTTIISATYSLVKLIENYVEEICQITRHALQVSAEYIDDPNILKTMEPDNIGGYPPLEKLYFQLTWHIKSFLMKVAIMKEEHIDWRFSKILLTALRKSEVYTNKFFISVGKIQCVANDQIETYNLLSQDQRFLRALKEAGRDFNEGYQKLLAVKTNR